MASDRMSSESTVEVLEKEDTHSALTGTACVATDQRSDRGVSHAGSGNISGLSAPRAGGVQLKADGSAVQMESDSWWERVKEDAGEMGMAMGLGGSGVAMSGSTAAGTMGGAVAMGLGLGTMAGEALWELDKSVLSSGASYEDVKEPEYEGDNPYEPSWYAPWTW